MEAPIPDFEHWSTATTAIVVVAVLGVMALVALVGFFAWPWRVEATLKATTHASRISIAGGLELFSLSGSAAAILGGPGVAAIHWRGRELWRHPIPQVSIDALFEWLEDDEPAKPKTVVGRIAMRAKNAVLARTDLADLPELGLAIFGTLREVSIDGSILFGSSDPVITGKTAAWAYPIASLLAPFGTLDVHFDWSGSNVLDGSVDISFRVVPARAVFEGLRFTRQKQQQASKTNKKRKEEKRVEPWLPKPSPLP